MKSANTNETPSEPLGTYKFERPDHELAAKYLRRAASAWRKAESATNEENKQSWISLAYCWQDLAMQANRVRF